MSEPEEHELKDRLVIRSLNDFKYVYIDYDGLPTNKMIQLLDDLIQLSKTEKLPFIANFTNTKIYPSYLIKGNEWINATKDTIPFGAFIGLDAYKVFLLDSIVSINGLKHRHFDSFDEALESLIEFYSNK